MESLVKLLVGLAWPAVALFVITHFSDELKRLINRVRSASKGRIEFDPQPQPESKASPTSSEPLTTPPPPPIPSGTGTTAAVPRDQVNSAYRPFFDEAVDRIRDNLPTLEARFSAANREEILIAVAAELNAALHLERASRSIFQSQVHALETSKDQTERLTKDAFRFYYDRAKAINPELYSKYDFEQWFGFLASMELVTVTPDNSVQITQAGKVVFRYMAERGYVPIPFA